MHRAVPIGRQLSGKLADPIASIRANNATNCTKERFCNDQRRSIDFSRGQALRRRAMARTRTWTAAAAEVERQRTCELAKIGNNLNQRGANTWRWRVSGCYRPGARHFGRAGRTTMMITSFWLTEQAQQQRRSTSPARDSPRRTRKRTRKKSKFCGAIRTKWPPWPADIGAQLTALNLQP